jgi:hypothetical protein
VKRARVLAAVAGVLARVTGCKGGSFKLRKLAMYRGRLDGESPGCPGYRP